MFMILNTVVIVVGIQSRETAVI